MAVAGNAALVAHGGLERLADGNAHVFHGVVAVNVQITHAVHVQINQAVAGNLIEHVVKKADAGGQPGAACAVQIQAHGNAGFGGVAGNFGGAGSIHDFIVIQIIEKCRSKYSGGNLF